MGQGRSGFESRAFARSACLLCPHGSSGRMERIVIVGNGIAGTTAARIARRRGFRGEVVLVSDEAPVPYSRPALMYVFMGHLKAAETKLYPDAFWPANGLTLRAGRAARLDPAARTLHLERGDTLAYDRLLIATGSSPRPLGVPGDALAVRLWGLADVARLEAASAGVRQAVVIGGGLTGVELCEMLRARGISVTFLVREPRLMPRTLGPAESARVEAELTRHGVDLRLNASVAALEGQGRPSAAVLADGTRVPCGLVAVAVGVAPNVDWLRGSGLVPEDARGVPVDAHLRTADPHVWAAGDCAQLPDGRVEQLWYTARGQGGVAGCALAGQPRPYAPGVPYNSARFFGLDWQGYGAYGGALADGHTEHVAHAGAATLRVVTDAEARLTGLSALGLRLDAERARAWIAARLPLATVRARLADLRFDAEFTPRVHARLAAALA